MKRLLILSLFTAALSAAQAPADDSNIACVQSMTLPDYSVVVVAGRISGDVRASVVVSPTGTSTDFKSDGSTMLISAVRTAMEAAGYSRECAGKTVKIVFRFGLENAAVESNPPRQRWSFSYPNIFSIVSEARLPQQ